YTHPATTMVSTLSLHDALPISYRTDGWSSQGWTSGLVPGNPPDPGYAKGFDWNLPSVFADPANQAPDFINESGLTNAELANAQRSEEHTSELQSRENLVCRPLL